MRASSFSLVVAISLGVGAAVAGCSCSSDAPSPPPPGTDATDPLIAPLEALRAESSDPLGLTMVGGYPESVNGRFHADGATRAARARSFLAAHATVYGLTDDVAIDVRRAGNEQGLDHVVVHADYKDVPVWNAELTVVLDGTDVVATFGRLLPPGIVVDEHVGLTGEQAVSLVRERTGATAARRFGRLDLVVYDPAIVDPTVPSEPRYAWRFDLDAAEHVVDARDGALLLDLSSSVEALHEVVLQEKLPDPGGDRALTADEWGCRAAWTIPAGWSCRSNIEAKLSADFRDTYLFWQQRFNWDSYNGGGASMEIISNDDFNDNAAFEYNPFGSWFHFRDNWVSRDAVAHEFGHGIIHNTSDLSYSGFPGALNEGFADLFGELVQWKIVNQTTGAGAPGEDMQMRDDPTFTAMRSLCFPDAVGSPRPINQSGYVYTNEDNGGVHTNSAIPTRAVCVWARTSFPSLTGPGVRDQLARIVWATNKRLNSSAHFEQARDAMALSSWFGPSDPSRQLFETCAVATGWNTVGVAPADSSLGYLSGSLCSTPWATDVDRDWVIDAMDNCPMVANPSQKDFDKDGTGDVCDPDRDGDGVANSMDNCPDKKNADQANVDHDQEGDLCDTDRDGDYVPNDTDNCPDDYNPDQMNTDGDRGGDVCDPDEDGDGVWGFDDNCPNLSNPGQENADGDPMGDACDRCPMDVDEVRLWTAGVSVLGLRPEPVPVDDDEDGIPDACDDSPATNAYASVDGRGPYDPRSMALGPEPHSLHAELADGVATLPLPPCVGACPEAWDDSDQIVLELEGLVAGTTAVVVDERGRALDRARAEASGTNARLVFLPRGGRSYALVFGAPPGATAIDVGIAMTVDLFRPEVARTGCEGVPDGAACAATGGAGSCDASGACAASRCGDGIVDRTAGEECDDGNATDGDGCSATCVVSCAAGATCDDGNACTTSDVCNPTMGGCAGVLVDGDSDAHAPLALGACGDDCHDGNPDVHPGRTEFSPAGYCPEGSLCDIATPPDMLSFDFDCSGVAEQRWTASIAACPTDMASCSGEAWFGSVPACGFVGEWVTCTWTPAAGCYPALTSRTQECR